MRPPKHLSETTDKESIMKKLNLMRLATAASAIAALAVTLGAGWKWG